MYKSYKIRLYPNIFQLNLINKTIGCTRFIYNQMLKERIEVYEKLKDNKRELYEYKYKTEKQYKEEFPFLKEVSANVLQQSRINLINTYKKFFNSLKKTKKVGFPKFKSKHKSKWSFRMPQSRNKNFKTPNILRIENNKINLPKLKLVRFKGLSNNFQGEIKSVTVIKSRSGKYFASILTEINTINHKERKNNNIIGIDLGLKNFITCSNGEMITGIKDKILDIENRIKKQQKHFSRKKKGSNRYEKCKIKLNTLHEYKRNFIDHFQWNLVNKLCSENQAISIEKLNVVGMMKNRKLSHAIYSINWGSFIQKLKSKAIEYETEIFEVDRFFPSSKMCSRCGNIKDLLELSNRTYICQCGLEIDRDLNAAINLRNNYLLINKSAKYVDYRHGEIINPKKLIYTFYGNFDEVPTFSKV